MKKLLVITFLCFIIQPGFSQNLAETIKDGSRLEYIFDLHGQIRTVQLILQKNSDTLSLHWKLREKEGDYIVLPEGLQKGKDMSFKQGVPSQTIVLEPDETFCMISQTAFQELVKNDSFAYNKTTYVLKDANTHIDVEGNSLKVIHVAAKIDKTEMWILDNARYPMVAKMRKNPLGINFTLKSISVAQEESLSETNDK